MNWMMRRLLLASAAIARAPEGETGGGDAPAPTAPAVENVLFPNEGEQPPAAPTDAPAAVAGDWKEYEADPAKSDEENAAAKAEHDKAKPAETDPADKVPEDGKYDLKMPDGVELDVELAAALGPDFKDLGLTNAQAQKLVDKYIATQQDRAAKQTEAWAGTVQKWADDAKADKEIGGAKWEQTVAASRRAVGKLGSPELREYLNASGGGNHPEMIRFMAKVGAMISEDSPANGGAGGQGKPVDHAYALFPSDAPKG